MWLFSSVSNNCTLAIHLACLLCLHLSATLMPPILCFGILRLSERNGIIYKRCAISVGIVNFSDGVVS